MIKGDISLQELYHTNIWPQLIPAVKCKVEVPDLIADYEPSSLLRKCPRLEDVLSSAETSLLPTTAIDPVMPSLSNSVVRAEQTIPLLCQKGHIPSEALLPLQDRQPVVSELTLVLDDVPVPLPWRNTSMIPHSTPVPSEVPVPFSWHWQSLVVERSPVESKPLPQPFFLGSLLKFTGFDAKIPLHSLRLAIPVVPQNSEPSDDPIKATTAQFQTIVIAPQPHLTPTPIAQPRSGGIPPDQFYGTGKLGSLFSGFTGIPQQEPKKVVQFKVQLEDTTPLHVHNAGGPRSQRKTLSPSEPINYLSAEPLVLWLPHPAQAYPPDEKAGTQISSSSRMSLPLSLLPPFLPTPGMATPQSSPRWPLSIPHSPSTGSEDTGIKSEAVDQLDSDDAPEQMAIDEPSTVVEATHLVVAPPMSIGSNPMLAFESLLHRFNAPESLPSANGIGMSTATSDTSQVHFGESFKEIKQGINGLDWARNKKQQIPQLLLWLLEAEMYLVLALILYRTALQNMGLMGKPFLIIYSFYAVFLLHTILNIEYKYMEFTWTSKVEHCNMNILSVVCTPHRQMEWTQHESMNG